MTGQTLNYLAIDIETAPAPDEAIDTLMADWKPPGNVKDPAKIEARRVEAEEKAQEKASLLDASPIICIGYGHTDASVIHTLDHAALYDGFGQESRMLDEFADCLAMACSSGTEIVGHNLLGFDLPKLRLAYIRHGIPIPPVLCYRPDRRQPVYDTMLNFRYFSTEHNQDRFCSLELVCHTLGVEYDDGGLKGKDVAAAYEEGRHDEIIRHCHADIATTIKVYRAMTGAS